MGDSTRARGYQIHEFARLTGLTVRALQHYDHLGLLKPVRSRAGHRTYSDQDLQALVQILALKSVGVPLRQIAALRRSGGPGLARALHMQRAVLERRRPLLDKAITAITVFKTLVTDTAQLNGADRFLNELRTKSTLK